MCRDYRHVLRFIPLVTSTTTTHPPIVHSVVRFCYLGLYPMVSSISCHLVQVYMSGGEITTFPEMAACYGMNTGRNSQLSRNISYERQALASICAMWPAPWSIVSGWRHFVLMFWVV